jgi:hypothetical protein
MRKRKAREDKGRGERAVEVEMGSGALLKLIEQSLRAGRSSALS